LWSTGSIADSIIVNASSGKIWLIGYYGNGICLSDTVFRTISVDNPILKITGQLTYCKNNSTTIKASGCKKYFWSNGQSAEEITISNSGNYWVVGQSENGCFSDTLKFTISEEPDWILTLTGANSFCKGDSTLIAASGGVNYSWNNGKTTASIYAKTSGKYIVTAHNQRGCIKTDSITISEISLPNSEFEMSNTKIDMLNNRVTFFINSESEVQYSWSLGDGTIKTGNSTEHSYNVTNIYTDYQVTLTAINKNGCASTTTKTIQVIPFVPNVFTPNKDGINELFMPGVELYIYDRNGQTLYKGNSGWDGTYNGKDMPSDTYFYYLTYLDKNQMSQSLKGYLTLIRK
jgi:gliding motility-associated-like protein